MDIRTKPMARLLRPLRPWRGCGAPWYGVAALCALVSGMGCCAALPGTSPVPPPAPQPCNLGLQDKYGRPFWHGTRPFATCGEYNDETNIDFTDKPCCCEFCGQRDPFEQLCEITTLLCTTVDDCVQRHNGTCRASAPARSTGGALRFAEPFHVFWMTIVVVSTVAPFIVPVVALWYAQEVILGF